MTFASILSEFLLSNGYFVSTPTTNPPLEKCLEWIESVEDAQPFLNWLQQRLEPRLCVTLEQDFGITQWTGLEVLGDDEVEFKKNCGEFREEEDFEVNTFVMSVFIRWVWLIKMVKKRNFELHIEENEETLKYSFCLQTKI
jgi:hypothetical protein